MEMSFISRQKELFDSIRHLPKKQEKILFHDEFWNKI
jgi:hypothetical protein